MPCHFRGEQQINHPNSIRKVVLVKWSDILLQLFNLVAFDQKG